MRGRVFSMLFLAACAGGPAQPATRTGPPAVASDATTDSLQVERDSLMNAVLRRIAGREQMPAESVFRDIRVLRGVPAGRLPRIMNLGWSRSLGVSCSHCHVVGRWADESKPQKEIARDMNELVARINTDLGRIPNLRSERPVVNCTTCHRGQVKPAVNMN